MIEILCTDGNAYKVDLPNGTIHFAVFGRWLPRNYGHIAPLATTNRLECTLSPDITWRSAPIAAILQPWDLPV